MKSEKFAAAFEVSNDGFALKPSASLLRMFIIIEKDEAEFGDVSRQLEASPIAQLVRAPH